MRSVTFCLCDRQYVLHFWSLFRNNLTDNSFLSSCRQTIPARCPGWWWPSRLWTWTTTRQSWTDSTRRPCATPPLLARSGQTQSFSTKNPHKWSLTLFLSSFSSNRLLFVLMLVTFPVKIDEKWWFFYNTTKGEKRKFDIWLLSIALLLLQCFTVCRRGELLVRTKFGLCARVAQLNSSSTSFWSLVSSAEDRNLSRLSVSKVCETLVFVLLPVVVVAFRFMLFLLHYTCQLSPKWYLNNDSGTTLCMSFTPVSVWRQNRHKRLKTPQARATSAKMSFVHH